jgi:predicted acylesterase/phospholipase RssA
MTLRSGSVTELPAGAGTPLRALCLDGGGYLGLATASFLAECERHFGRSCSDAFDLFSGTSTGGLIALALAAGKSAADVVQLYKTLGERVFWNPHFVVRWGRAARGIVFARYSNAPLAAVLDEIFGSATLADLSKRNKRVVVPAYCLTTGRPRVFKTDHSAELTAHGEYKLRDVALATSAAPTYLPIVTIRAPTTGVPERFVDGGVCANNPALLAYTEAVGYLGHDPANVRLLSVSTPRVDASEKFGATWASKGLLGWGARLPAMFIDPSMTLTDAALGRLLRRDGTYRRVDLRNAASLKIDDASAAATQTLIQIGADAAASTAQRDAVACFFGRTHG